MIKEKVKFFSEKRTENKKEIGEQAFFSDVYSEIKKILEESGYVKRIAKIKEKPRKNRRGNRYSLHKAMERDYIKSLRDRLIKKYPQEAGTIAALVNLGRSCEWQFITTHLLIDKNEAFAQNFWRTLEKISLIYGGFSKDTRAGIIGQVGTYKTLEYFGMNPKLATPSEDAMKKIDLWFGPGEATALQVKQHIKAIRPQIMVDKKISYPSVSVSDEEEENHFSADSAKKISRIQEAVDKCSIRKKKKVRAFRIVCSMRSFNPFTGQPSKEFLDQIQPEIKKYFKDVRH